ncbi:DUF5817 domain-containing protein [Halorubrum ezzemoulense]|uniref:DUF5817 domain-containing protein n=2 Tax=Halorubrum ezzemoulense TaxID=337243 RepID=A0A256JNZ2_HALEZ|nr:MULTISPECIES: DUF5817 domain-containing protein [Halorubrum]MDB2238208.1 DUF5817 domain-containing protein [Halorubrum ezzemoulense]MDB2240139.1 DUF5817 domain-containing protein [Halorubrum ezzemoulense]MDB2243927.1 DUF5817 domain-containing protein [Halorubrum ezzemoulense]MDB2247677.1 DUF5817 domain-containing protein [Halorubrum ezzemoulense]MDB2251993.1 DUF5817 domain-containing protein [Halorubrum ezzemoulense]
MYAVVGCNECANMWLVTDPETSETAKCSRCGKTHRTAKLKRFFESEERAAARQARSALLAKKRGDSAAFAEVDHVADLEAAVEDAGIGDREYLESSGIDADAVDEAASRAEGGGGGSRSRTEVVRDAVDALDDPTEAAVVDRAAADGVPADAAREILTRLAHRGELTESNGRYRLL